MTILGAFTGASDIPSDPAVRCKQSLAWLIVTAWETEAMTRIAAKPFRVLRGMGGVDATSSGDGRFTIIFSDEDDLKAAKLTFVHGETRWRCKPGELVPLSANVYSTTAFFTRPQITRAMWVEAEGGGAAATHVAPEHDAARNTAAAVNATLYLAVDTDAIPDGTPATLTIRGTGDDRRVTAIGDLHVVGNRVVDATGHRPRWQFLSRHLPWSRWNDPRFHFHVTVTPDDGSGPYELDSAPLRVYLWHVVVADSGDPLILTDPEADDIRDVYLATPGHKVLRHSLAAGGDGALFRSLLRNSYSYHHTSHGTAVCRVDGATAHVGGWTRKQLTVPWACRGDVAGVAAIDQRSLDLQMAAGDNAGIENAANLLAADFIQPGDINHPMFCAFMLVTGPATQDLVGAAQLALVDAPTTFAYLSCCMLAWEPTLIAAFLGAGTHSVLAFERLLPAGQGRVMSLDFHRRWAATGCDPAQIRAVFLLVSPMLYDRRPRLFSQAGITAPPDPPPPVVPRPAPRPAPPKQGFFAKLFG